MAISTLVAVTLLTTLALLVRCLPASTTIAPKMAERAALEWVGSGRVTHHLRTQRDGRAVFRVLVRDDEGSVHELDVCGQDGRVIGERLAA